MKKWLWKILLVPALLVVLFGLIGLLYPYPYISFYLNRTVQTAWQPFHHSNPDLSLLLEGIFRANGLAVTMVGILAVFIIAIPFRNDEKWAVYALVIVGTIGFFGELILEIMIL